MELVSEPLDASDTPLLLTCRLPGNRAHYIAKRAALLEWWDLQYDWLDHVILIMPLQQG